MGIHICNCSYKEQCDCSWDKYVSGLMTQKDLDFAKENRERVKKFQELELENLKND